ncbi:sigma-54 dependent transcriptional regulator [soil metagenome]
MAFVLVVDDKEMLRDSVGSTLARAGMTVQTADGAEEALQKIAERRPDCVITDLKMPGMTGIDLLQELRKLDEEIPVVLMTAFATVETAVKAMRLGAFDYISKPFEGDQLIIAVKRACEHARLTKENAVLRAAAGGGMAGASAGAGAGLSGLDRLVGTSPAMRRVKEQVMAVAESHGTVLVFGESGTGKEVVARAVHEISGRRSGAFLGVNCAALAENLLESELFGHEKGAFTGAERTRKGRFELADGGTLLLDEISEVSTRIQAKLLRVLQERVIERVGSSASIGVDVRVIATSNRDLPRAISSGEFRQDLFFRLNVLPIHMPPLRDRAEDIGMLAEHFVAKIAARDGKPNVAWTPDALAVLSTYAWPGNVRELQNICERAAVLCRGGAIERELVEPWLIDSEERVETLPIRGPIGSVAHVHAAKPGASNGSGNGVVTAEVKPGPLATVVPIHDRLLEDIERDAIVNVLTRFRGHRQKTAHALGIGVRTLGLKLKKWKHLQLVDEGM